MRKAFFCATNFEGLAMPASSQPHPVRGWFHSVGHWLGNHPLSLIVAFLAAVLAISTSILPVGLAVVVSVLVTALAVVWAAIFNPSHPMVELPCPYCKKSGKVKADGGTIPCPVCRGRGKVETDREGQPKCAFCDGKGRAPDAVCPCPICGGNGLEPWE